MSTTSFSQMRTSKKVGFVLSVCFTVAALVLTAMVLSMSESLLHIRGAGGIDVLVAFSVAVFVFIIVCGALILSSLLGAVLACVNLRTPIRWVRVTSVVMLVLCSTCALIGIFVFCF